MEILRIICCILLLAAVLPAGNGLSLGPGPDHKSHVLAGQEGSVDLTTNQYDASHTKVERTGLKATSDQRGRKTVEIDWRIAQHSDVSPGEDTGSRRSSSDIAGTGEADRVWRSQELNILAIGMGVGDVDGDGANEIVLIDPDTVYLYRFSSAKMELPGRIFGTTPGTEERGRRKAEETGPGQDLCDSPEPRLDQFLRPGISGSKTDACCTGFSLLPTIDSLPYAGTNPAGPEKRAQQTI